MRRAGVGGLWLALATAGCGDSATTASDAGVDRSAMVDVSGDSAAASDVDQVRGLRGARYCEVLVARLAGATVHVEVYNTIGLGDCPDAAWRALDASAIMAQTGAVRVVLNGPRYWMLDAFVRGDLIDPTVVTFGALPMRRAGGIDVPLAQVASVGRPYELRTIQRTSVVRFAAGAPVFELVDGDGHVYEMQSYSVQSAAITQADLPTLASRLMLPAGWMYRTRTPSQDLVVTAVDNLATVVQDDLGNTYQRSQ